MDEKFVLKGYVHHPGGNVHIEVENIRSKDREDKELVGNSNLEIPQGFNFNGGQDSRIRFYLISRTFVCLERKPGQPGHRFLRIGAIKVGPKEGVVRGGVADFVEYLEIFHGLHRRSREFHCHRGINGDPEDEHYLQIHSHAFPQLEIEESVLVPLKRIFFNFAEQFAQRILIAISVNLISL